VESWKVLHEGMLQDLQVANKAMQDSPIKLQAEKEVAMSLERRLEEMGHSHKKEREELIQALREETNALREQQLSNTHLRQALNEEQEQACALRSELQQVNRGLLDLQAQLSESDRLQSQLDAADASLASTKQRLEAAERCRGEDLQLHELELKKLQGDRFRDIFCEAALYCCNSSNETDCPSACRRVRQRQSGTGGTVGTKAPNRFHAARGRGLGLLFLSRRFRLLPKSTRKQDKNRRTAVKSMFCECRWWFNPAGIQDLATSIAKSKSRRVTSS
jgi:hypothetical protein